MAYAYFKEKASVTIREMFAHPGTSRERLLAFETQIKLNILSLDMPDELLDKKAEIEKYINKKHDIKSGSTIVRTAFKNSVLSMRNSTASKVLDSIYSLYFGVTSRY